MYRKHKTFLAQRKVDFINIVLVMAGMFTVQTTNVMQDVNSVEGVTDGMARLPCTIAENGPTIKPRLILWYKNGGRRPFFTLDLRTGYPENIVDPSVKERVKYDIERQWLTIRPLIIDDTAQYKCQVDYDNSPTLSAFVNLTIYEPPSRIILHDGQKRIISSQIFGPLLQDSVLILFCTVVGGRPRPQLSWWYNSKLLTDERSTATSSLSFHEEIIENDSIEASLLNLAFSESFETSKVVSRLQINHLSRDYAGRKITCKAQNNNITSPLMKSISLNIYLKPSSVEIIYPKSKLKEGYETKFMCLTKGSEPPAKVRWYKTVGEQVLELPSKKDEERNEETLSVLVFKPIYTDHGSSLSCKAQNPEMTNGGIKQTTILRVAFSPRVILSLGVVLTKTAIREGDDVYFDCHIRSNPKARHVEWRKDGNRIYQDLKSGVLVSDKNLVLQRIHRRYSGNYTCTASNELGKSESNAIHLPVMFLPVCNSRQTTVSVAERKSVNLKCDVKANPSHDLSFIWSFNNTLDTVEVSSEKIDIMGTTSILHYTPLTTRDYGMLSCWATNVVGVQAEPCRFGVVEEGPPGRVKDCILVNLTGGALDVRCSSGNNSRAAQKFVAKIYSSPNHKLVRVLERKQPQFHVADLIPGVDYLVTIIAVNDKGFSEPEKIDAIRLKVAEKRMGEVVSPPVSPLVGVFLSLVGGFVLLLAVVLFLTKGRSNINGCWKNSDSQSSKSSEAMLGISPNESKHRPRGNSQSKAEPFQQVRLEKNATFLTTDDENGPDILKISNETSQLIKSRLSPEMVLRRGNYGSGVVKNLSEISGMSSELVASTEMKCQSHRSIQSPIKLPSDESFV